MKSVCNVTFQVRIQDFAKWSPKRPKVTNVGKQSYGNEMSYLWLGSQAGAVSLLIFNAQICFLNHSRDSFPDIFDI